MMGMNAAKWVVASVSAAAVLAAAGTANAQTPCFGATGPDVIVGDLTGPSNYAIDASKQMDAFSMGTTSCNMGQSWLNWIASTNQHPVIGGGMYKMKNGRFEQLGFSWLKHGFYALSQNLCCNPCSSTDGTHLGIRCSDPYTSDRNGTQGNLGPRWQVNATTGYFVYPPANPSFSGNSARRIQVKLTDLEASSASVIYIAEAQYVTPDDALAGNGTNNVSWRRLTMVDSGGTANRFNAAFSGATVRQQAAIQAWKQYDPTVTLVTTDVPADGRYWTGCKVTDLGNGTWSYEYAIQNINSDRSGASFSVPLPEGVVVTNIGFHDVSYLDGDGIPTGTNPNTSARNFDGTDWTGVASNGSVTWTCAQTYAENTNANALRWGTLYNFRFVANVGPQAGDATLGLFKPATGQPDAVVVAAINIPGELACSPCAADYDRDGGVTGGDISAFFADYETGASCADVDLDGGVTAGDLAFFFSLYEQGGC